MQSSKHLNAKNYLQLFKPDLEIKFIIATWSHYISNLLSFTASDLLISVLKLFFPLVYLFPALLQNSLLQSCYIAANLIQKCINQ